ncbi:MAG: leucine-rich repeat domain-containing protein [Spirochaetales bacterium]|nr:leucine-rich repeat domain-containing protein [Spirochaetales bacterium]
MKRILSILDSLNIGDIDALYSRGDLGILGKEMLDDFFVRAFKEKGPLAVFPLLKRFIYFYDILGSSLRFTDFLSHFLCPHDARIIERIDREISAGRHRRLTFDCRPACFSEVVFDRNGNVTELHLNVLDLEKFPACLCGLGRLEILDLGFNTIRGFPASLKKMEGLQSLDLSNNDLSRIPKQLSGMNRLKRLNLRYNNITSLPDWFEALVNLRYLDVSHNGIQSFPEVICDMKNLKVLNLGFNAIGKLPSSIRRLADCEELHLEYNGLVSLPESLTELRGLRVLDISHNRAAGNNEALLRRLHEMRVIVVTDTISC